MANENRNQGSKSQGRGFAGMEDKKQRETARKGGKASHGGSQGSQGSQSGNR